MTVNQILAGMVEHVRYSKLSSMIFCMVDHVSFIVIFDVCIVQSD